VVSHDAKFLRQEVELANALGDVADRIIILNSWTVEAARDRYEIPRSKVVHIPHASYLGVYPPPLSRVEVRSHLGIPDGLQTIGFVGAIRPYKGVGDLLEASRLVAGRRPRCGVVLAGNTSALAMREVDAHMPHNLAVFRRHTVLTDSEIAAWVSASDVMVLPYRGILNSGSMMLAATFGVPVVLPNLDHLVDEFGDQEWITFFEERDEDEVRWASIAEAIEMTFDDRRHKSRAAAEFARAYTPWDMTKAYADLVDSTMDA
jgi:glycosyltransferase involved in cell wall biosynthesis